MGEVNETATSPTEVTGGVLSGADPLNSTIALFLLQVVIIMATTKLLAFGLKYLNQPRVIAEILAGILLGPSGMGNIPGWLRHVFPEHSLAFLTLVANIGLILYMFLVGLELTPEGKSAWVGSLWGWRAESRWGGGRERCIASVGLRKISHRYVMYLSSPFIIHVYTALFQNGKYLWVGTRERRDGRGGKGTNGGRDGTY